MKRKIAVIFLALVIASFSLTGCSESSSEGSQSAAASSEQSQQTSQTEQSSQTATTADGEEYFAEGDLRDVSNEEPNAVITLSGSEGTISDTTRGSSGSDVTISSKGVYQVTGSSENVSIIINDEKKSGNIYLVLDEVSMTNSEKPCIIVEKSEKVIVVCKSSSESTLIYTCEDNSDGLDGAIYAEDDLTISGSGEMHIESAQHGIVCKDDFKFLDSNVSVDADSIGIKAGDSVRIGSGSLVVNSEHDGIRVENKDGTSFFYIADGASAEVNAGYDGVDVGTSGADFTGYVLLDGGTVDITAGCGSDNSKSSETSQKGLKCDGDIIVGNVAMTISSPDDSVHSKGSVTVSDGNMSLSSSDDGITASGDLTIKSGTVSVTKSYEGLEASSVTIEGGTVSVVSSDDGINAGGGSDTSDGNSDEFGSTDGMISISGGEVYVNASGDGVDSNGSISISGGAVIVEGPTDSGNGALDKGDGSACTATITGGTVLAIGSTGMAINFDSGTQCSALVSLSGKEGTEITVDDGSGFTYTTTKSFDCVVYSSPDLKQGSSYTISAGSATTEVSFSDSLYYSDVMTMGGGMMMGGNMGASGRP